jgi:hypothetical protein
MTLQQSQGMRPRPKKITENKHCRQCPRAVQNSRKQAARQALVETDCVKRGVADEKVIRSAVLWQQTDRCCFFRARPHALACNLALLVNNPG